MENPLVGIIKPFLLFKILYLYFCKVRMNNIFYVYLLYWFIWLLSYRYLFLNTSIFYEIIQFLSSTRKQHFWFYFYLHFLHSMSILFDNKKYKIIYWDRWLLILLNFIIHGHCNPICWLELQIANESFL